MMNVNLVVPDALALDQDALKAALKQCGKLFQKTARMLINSGLPDMPHNRTGLLSKSIGFRVSSKKGVLTLTVIDKTRYATALFAGSTRKNGVKVKGSPLFDETMKRCRPKMEKILEDAARIIQ